jgi:NDP-sugar pyrophosphorylase family protein
MEGMILAAGAGTRLGPLTADLPKALVQVGGKPLLGWVLERLVDAEVGRIIINTHHHEDRIREYVRRWSPAGVDFVFSPEPDGPYETGGGLLRAAGLFREPGPFLLHNADVLSSIPLRELVTRHVETRERVGPSVIASVAVQDRASSRKLLFDDHGLLGWENRGSDRAPDGRVDARDAVGAVYQRSFTGIHVVDPAIFTLSERTGSFSIIALYLELAAAGWVVNPLDVSDFEWLDVGTPERLEEARRLFPG